MPLLALPLVLLAAMPPPAPIHWVASWSASAAPLRPEIASPPPLWVDNQTLREIVHVSLGGPRVRVRLSNLFAPGAAWVGAASVAVRGGPPQPLTFGGQRGILLPDNAEVVSDPVALAVPDGGDLAINLYIPRRCEAGGFHYSAQQMSFIEGGDDTAAPDWPAEGTAIHSWAFLAGVDVAAGEQAYTVVAFGDSITDGAHSSEDGNDRWPDVLAERLRAAPATRSAAVVDAGIGGNRLLHDFHGNPGFGVNALSRFDRDVLAQPGARVLIVVEGINDLGHAGSNAPADEAVTAPQLIAAYSQLAARAHEHGLLVILGTLLPFEGTLYRGYYTSAKEAIREQFNDWIRSNQVGDGVVDFDQLTRDPAHPLRMLPAFDSGDHLHPNDAGYRAMGEAAARAVDAVISPRSNPRQS